MFESRVEMYGTFIGWALMLLLIATFAGLYGHIVYILFKWGWDLVG
jgi:hypothetical protein